MLRYHYLFDRVRILRNEQEAPCFRKKKYSVSLLGLGRFTAVIDERDRKILSVLQKPLSLTEIAERGLIYGRKYHVDAWIYMWEFIMIRKHVQRMVGQGRILDLGDQLIAA